MSKKQEWQGLIYPSVPMVAGWPHGVRISQPLNYQGVRKPEIHPTHNCPVHKTERCYAMLSTTNRQETHYCSNQENPFKKIKWREANPKFTHRRYRGKRVEL